MKGDVISKWKIVKRATPLFCSFLVGIVFMLMLGFTKEELVKTGLKEILKPGEFGDISIIKGKSPQWPEEGEALVICKKDCPFVAIKKDKLGMIKEVSVFDGSERELIKGSFEEDKLKKIYVLTNNDSGVFSIERSAKPNLWQNANYCKLSKNTKSFFTGENYIDIDFDGHFDIKSIWDDSLKEITNNLIFINGKWQEVGTFNLDKLEATSLFINGKFQKVSPDDIELIKQLSALPQSAKKKAYYDFEFGKGWKQREEKEKKGLN